MLSKSGHKPSMRACSYFSGNAVDEKEGHAVESSLLSFSFLFEDLFKSFVAFDKPPEIRCRQIGFGGYLVERREHCAQKTVRNHIDTQLFMSSSIESGQIKRDDCVQFHAGACASGRRRGDLGVAGSMPED
jgi:hypothetical protein